LIYQANKYVGVREKTGNNDGYEVELFLASTNLNAGYPWCAAFITYIHKQCNLDIPESPAWSPSWFPKNKLVNKYEANPGDVFGIYFSDKKRIAHVGLCEKIDDVYMITIEGNTNKAGSREGDGVYKKRRPLRTIYKVAQWYE